MPTRQKSKSEKSTTFKIWTQAHPNVTTLLIVVSIPVIITIIVAGVYFTNVALDAIKRQALAATVEKGAVAARAEKEQSFDNSHQHKIDVLKAAGVVTPDEKAFSSKLDTCGMSSTVQGWVATNWAQYCMLRYTDLLPTILSRDEIVSRLSSHIETASLFGEVATNGYTKTCDDLYQLNYSKSLYYYVWTVDPVERSGSCGVPAPESSDAGAVVAGWHDETRTVRTFNASGVDKTKTYIGVFSNSSYYRSDDLGCYGFLFCSPPFELPQSGFNT